MNLSFFILFINFPKRHQVDLIDCLKTLQLGILIEANLNLRIILFKKLCFHFSIGHHGHF
jgi:hypothetical protein